MKKSKKKKKRTIKKIKNRRKNKMMANKQSMDIGGSSFNMK